MEKMTTSEKRPVSARAVLQRINRKLKADCEGIRKSRPAHIKVSGKYYRVEYRRSRIVENNVDLERLAKRLEVIEKWETLERVDNDKLRD